MAVAVNSGSFTNRQVARLQGRGEGLEIDAAGAISRQGTVVGRCDLETKLGQDLKAVIDNLDKMGAEYRQGRVLDAAAAGDLERIAALAPEVMLMPSSAGAQIRVGAETAPFQDVEAARDLARLMEDCPQLARDLLDRRGVEIGAPKPALGDLDESAPAAEPRRPSGFEIEQ